MDGLKQLFFLPPFIIISFWSVTLIFDAVQKKQHLKVPLILFFIDSLLAVFESGIFYLQWMNLFRILYIPAVFCSLSMFPLFYMYICRLTGEKEVRTKSCLQHLISPFLCTILAFVVFMGFMNTNERTIFFNHTILGENNFSGIQKFAFYFDDVLRKTFLITSIGYYLLTDKKIRKHKTRLQNYFSNSDEGEISWFPILRISFFLTLVSAFFYFSIQRYSSLQLWVLPAISHVLLALFFWIAGYYGLQQHEIKLYVPKLLDSKDNIKVPEDVLAAIHESIENKMIQEQLFLKEGLTLPELARSLGTNRSYLSRYFNDYLKQSYSYYVNKKRIEHACYLIKQNDLNINDLFTQSGFNSNASFYRWFKRIMKVSPQRYLEKENQ